MCERGYAVGLAIVGRIQNNPSQRDFDIDLKHIGLLIGFVDDNKNIASLIV